ncbi:hypothetical protein BT96DRAFT_1027481 [Gymnopus androsaceus JB14]|uniref:AB hydrolase-1 domain-containing protein n=1 Tax=Gymnopus androsaceus JB14 TaxID=1447944 RepID=A0A6A4GBL3_9AGAR|nr:hypothetical protein BT96DRAFT_1027481 [Gymnopus androsaceus JB14]
MSLSLPAYSDAAQILGNRLKYCETQAKLALLRARINMEMIAFVGTTTTNTSTMTIQFLIVPGAGHLAKAYSPLASALQNHGYKATIASYPSLNAPNPMSATCAQDGAAVRVLLLSLFEEGSEEEPKIVLVNHSYGGMVGCQAAYGEHLKGRRDAGKSGGVIGIINMAGFPGKEGVSLMQASWGKSAEYVRNNQVSLNRFVHGWMDVSLNAAY